MSVVGPFPTFLPGDLGANIVADFWQDFEFSASAGSMTTGQLDASTHGTDPTWTLRGTNNWSTSASGEQHVISTVNGLTDSGTTGLALSCDGSTFQSIQAAYTAVDAASAGIWFFVPASLSADSGIDIMQFSDSSGDLICLAAFRRISGVYSIRVTASSLVADISISVMSAFYWVSMKYTKLGTCSFAVFDATRSQVGTTQTVTDSSGHQTSNIRVGPEDTYSAITPVNAYWDDLVVDYTNAVFPLGP